MFLYVKRMSFYTKLKIWNKTAGLFFPNSLFISFCFMIAKNKLNSDP
jgi:hypothetical protein